MVFLYLLAQIVAIVLSIPFVALALLTKWDGTTTIFGNRKWGRANNHFLYPTKGYWQEFNWLVIRNPVYNLNSEWLAATIAPFTSEGDLGIGDKKKQGYYKIKMGRFFEFYLVKKYLKTRCLRIRIGWKINEHEGKAPFVFSINPFKKYSGI